MSSSVIESLSTKLFRVLQSSVSQIPLWLELKGDLENLAHTLRRYIEMLQDKNETMKLVHTSTVHWRPISDGLDLVPISNVSDKRNFIPLNTSYRILSKISETLIVRTPEYVIFSHSNCTGHGNFEGFHPLYLQPDSATRARTRTHMQSAKLLAVFALPSTLTPSCQGRD